MFPIPDPTDSILETYNFGKILKEQFQDVKRNCNLPYYLRILLKKRDEVYVDYIRTRSRANLITYFKLSQIYKEELLEFEKNQSIVNPDSTSDILEGIQRELMMSEVWYRTTNVKIFWDIHVGLFQVKEVIYGLKDVKRAEYDMLAVISN